MRRNDTDNSDGWLMSGSFWRAKLRLQIWCHRHPTVGDRWVFQPSLVWDRKAEHFASSDATSGAGGEG